VAYISKRKALKALRSNLARGEKLLLNEEWTEESALWVRDTDDLLRTIISEISELYQDFHKFSPFRSPTVVTQRVYLLRQAIRQIEEYGLISERTQVNPLMYRVVIPLALLIAGAVVSLFSPPVQRWLGFDPNVGFKMSEAEREMQCKQLAVLFANRLEEFDAEYRAGKDSLIRLKTSGVHKVPHLAPSSRVRVAFRELGEYNTRATMLRNNIVDSFLVAFEAADCDTTDPRLKHVLLK